MTANALRAGDPLQPQRPADNTANNHSNARAVTKISSPYERMPGSWGGGAGGEGFGTPTSSLMSEWGRMDGSGAGAGGGASGATGAGMGIGGVNFPALESLPPRRYKRSEKIDLEDPFTWSKGALRTALYACGVPNVKSIKAPGREGQQILARLVFELWGSPRKKLLSQKAAEGMERKLGEGSGGSVPSSPATPGRSGAEGRSSNGGGSESGLVNMDGSALPPSGIFHNSTVCVNPFF